jgi:hypothetical protein
LSAATLSRTATIISRIPSVRIRRGEVGVASPMPQSCRRCCVNMTLETKLVDVFKQLNGGRETAAVMIDVSAIYERT